MLNKRTIDCAKNQNNLPSISYCINAFTKLKTSSIVLTSMDVIYH